MDLEYKRKIKDVSEDTLSLINETQKPEKLIEWAFGDIFNCSGQFIEVEKVE